MIRRRPHALILLALVSGLLWLPSLALGAGAGGNGGAGMGGTPTGSGTSSGPSAAPSGPVSASGEGITVNTSASSMLRTGLTFSGTAPASDAGQTIEIDRLGHQTQWLWAQTVTATINSDGTFSATWHTNHIGRFSIRAHLMQANANSASSAGAAPTLTVTVYRSSIATLYGPGFYGNRTACGKRLTRSVIGVASRTLPCGSKVALFYRGRIMTVPVIDRGPYANHADWDLTMATGRALGVTTTARIGAVSLPRPPAAS